MGKNRILLAVFYRVKAHYLMALVTLITTIVSVLGTFIVLANVNNHMVYEITKNIPIHISFTIKAESNDTKAYMSLNNYIIEFYGEIQSLPEVNKTSICLTYSLPSLLSMYVGFNNSEYEVWPTIGVFYEYPLRYNVSGEIAGNGIGIAETFARKWGLNIGDHVNITIVHKVLNRTVVEYRDLEIKYIYSTGSAGYLTSSVVSAGTGSSSPGFIGEGLSMYPAIVVNESLFKQIIKALNPYTCVSVHGERRSFIAYTIDIVLSNRYLVLYNPDLACQLVDEFIDSRLSEHSKKIFGKDIIPRKITTFFMTIRETKTVDININDSTIRLLSIINSPLQEKISSLKSVMQFQMTSLVITASLPIFISSWYLMVVIAGIMIHGLRRHLALLITRGVPPDMLKKSYIILMSIISVLAIILSLPLINIVSRTFTILILGRIFYEPSLTDPFIIVSGAVITAILVILVLRRSRKYLYIDTSELSSITRVFMSTGKTSWKPGTLLTILLIISIMKYGLWLSGFTVTDLFRMAMETRNVGLSIALSIYAIIDSIAQYIAPFIVTYFLIQYITHSEKLLNIFSTIITRIISRNLSESVEGLILRGSSRLYSVSFVIALVFAVTLNYLGLSTSLEIWFPEFREFIRGTSGGEVIAIQELSYQAIIYANKLMVYYGFILALLSSILMALVLTRDLDKEIVVLRARGASAKDLLKLVYGVVFTVVSISLLVGLVSGLIWLKGEVDGVNSGIRLVSYMQSNSTSNIPYVSIAFSIHDIIYIVSIVSLLLIVPLIIIFLRVSKPVAEKLRSIV